MVLVNSLALLQLATKKVYSLKIRILENHRYPKLLKVDGITLYPFVLLAITKQKAIQTKLLNHEFVHVRQIEQLGFFKFYTCYLYEYLKNLIKFRNHSVAYRAISFEQQAYAEQHSYQVPKEYLI